MKRVVILTSSIFLIGLLVVAVWKISQQVGNRSDAEDKVALVLGDEFTIQFTRQGEQLLQPHKLVESVTQPASVMVKLATTSNSAGPPPREGATRPYLEVTNPFEKPLFLRGVVRMNGSSEFVPIQGIEPVLPTESMVQCWDFDTTVEEVVLQDFRLVD